MSVELTDVNEIVREIDKLVRKCKALHRAKAGINEYDELCYGELRTVDVYDVTEQINHMLKVCNERIKIHKEILGGLTAIDWEKATGKTLSVLYNRANMEEECYA